MNGPEPYDLTQECEQRGLNLRLGIADGVQTIILSRLAVPDTAMEVFKCETVRDAMVFLAGWDAAFEVSTLEDFEANALRP